jgi:hypothetical protein
MSYKGYIAMLRTELPVGDYILNSKTSLLAGVWMVAIALTVYFVFPLSLFQGFTLPLWLLTVAVFLGVAWLYYDYVYYPNEIADSESGSEGSES